MIGLYTEILNLTKRSNICRIYRLCIIIICRKHRKSNGQNPEQQSFMHKNLSNGLKKSAINFLKTA